MAKEQLTITVKNRIAKRVSNNQGRKENLIPAIVYGPKQASTPIYLTQKFFALSKATVGNSIYTLDGEKGLDGSKVMIKSIMKNPFGNKILHVDLYAPDMTKTVKIEVPLEFTGEPAGLKEGGLTQTLRRSIEIECSITDIPKTISVDISNLNIGDTLKMGEISVSEKFKVLSAPEYAVISVIELKAEKEKTTEEAAPAPAADATAAATDS